jgi:hypothetical protein
MRWHIGGQIRLAFLKIWETLSDLLLKCHGLLSTDSQDRWEPQLAYHLLQCRLVVE